MPSDSISRVDPHVSMNIELDDTIFVTILTGT